MRIIKAFSSGILIEISIHELKIIKNVINEVYKSISMAEFASRMGYSIEEFQVLDRTITVTMAACY